MLRDCSLPLKFVGLLIVCAFSRSLSAQTNVINVPPMTAPNVIFNNTILTLNEGGVLPRFFNANAGSVLNIEGGNVEAGLRANLASTVNVNGGNLAGGIFVEWGSNFNLRGGNVGDNFKANGTLNIFGDEFALDGIPVSGLSQIGDTVSIVLPVNAQFTGILSDGNPFAFAYRDNDDQLQNAMITLERTALPPIVATEIMLPADLIPNGLRMGQSLYVDDGGVLPEDFHAGTGSKLYIRGGNVGRNLEVVGAEVKITGGSIGDDFAAFAGSVVEVYDATIGHEFRLLGGSKANLRGGVVDSLLVTGEADLDILGGKIKRQLVVYDSGRVTIHGDAFQINGVPVAGLDQVGNSQAVELPAQFVLSGTLGDGTPFAFSNPDSFAPQTLSLTRAALPPVDQLNITLPGSPIPQGIRDGQTLVVGPGGDAGDFFTAGAGSSVIVEGGTMGENLKAVGAEVVLQEGQIGASFKALLGTMVQIDGGSVGRLFSVENGANAQINGGAFAGIVIQAGGTATIRGGNFERFNAGSDTELELIGRQFLVDGSPVAELASPGDSLLLPNRDGELLTAILADGSESEFLLSTQRRGDSHNIAVGSHLRLTIVPEPAAVKLWIIALLNVRGSRGLHCFRSAMRERIS